jgi:hypothetical protein
MNNLHFGQFRSYLILIMVDNISQFFFSKPITLIAHDYQSTIDKKLVRGNKHSLCFLNTQSCADSIELKSTSTGSWRAKQIAG